MTEQICGNCHFFGRPRKGINDDDIGDIDKTFCTDDEDGLQICGYLEHFNNNRSVSELPKNIPVVMDMSGFYAALRVPADFGCNKWQVKEVKPDGQVVSQQHD